MLECVVTEDSPGGMMSLQFRPLGSTTSTTSWSLMSVVPREWGREMCVYSGWKVC